MSNLNFACDKNTSWDEFLTNIKSNIDTFVSASDLYNNQTITSMDMVSILKNVNDIMIEFKDCVDWQDGKHIYRGKHKDDNAWSFITDNVKQTILQQFTHPVELSTGKQAESVNQMVRQFNDLIVEKIINYFSHQGLPHIYSPELIDNIIDYIIKYPPEKRHEDDNVVSFHLIKKSREKALIEATRKPLTQRERLMHIHEAVTRLTG